MKEEGGEASCDRKPEGLRVLQPEDWLGQDQVAQCAAANRWQEGQHNDAEHVHLLAHGDNAARDRKDEHADPIGKQEKKVSGH